MFDRELQKVLTMKPSWLRIFSTRFRWFVHKGRRGVVWLVLLALMTMTVMMGMTRRVDVSDSRGQTNYRGQRDVIAMRDSFLSERYLANAEILLRTLFPDQQRARSFGDVQMTFLRWPVHELIQSIHKGRRVRTYNKENEREAEKTGTFSSVLQYKQKSMTEMNPDARVAGEDQGRKLNQATLLWEPQKSELFPPQFGKRDIETDSQIPPSTAVRSEKRTHPSKEESDIKDKFSQRTRTQPLAGENDKESLAPSAEHPALRDFRLRAQRIARLCPPLVRNGTVGHSAPMFKQAWSDVEKVMSKSETVKGVLWDKESRTAYCFVPKAGCTFWIRVFSFLKNFTAAGQAAQSPWDIPRLALHSKQQNPSARGAPLWQVENEVMAPDSLRFMVIRDPFARLWSAYVDKFILPDFWGHTGIYVVRRFRKNPTAVAKKCGNDVTFTEFIQYALAVRNDHWEPIYKRCDPCRFRPQVVADITSFSRDSTLVLRRMGQEHVLETLDKTQQKERELTTLMDFNFDILNSTQGGHHKDCLSLPGVARLLWKAFQINGYLPVQTPYSPGPEEEEEEKFSVPEFKNHVIRVFRQSQGAGVAKALKTQKKFFMDEAYRSLSPELLQRVRDVYRLDFAFFGYDDSPFTS